jgi:Flp pilus assembly protein TadD
MKSIEHQASEGEMAEFLSSEHSMFTNKRTTDFEQFNSGQSIAWLARFVLLSAALLSVAIIHVHAQQAHAVSKDDLFCSIVASVKQGDFAGALNSSALALQTSPNDYQIWILRGMAYSDFRKNAPAQIAFEHALKLAPSYLTALEGEAQLKYKQAEDGARPFLLRVPTVLPNDPTSHGVLAILDYREKDCAGAVLNFRQAKTTIASQPDGLLMYGKCFATTNHYEEAIPVFQRAVSLDTTKHGARFDLALCQWNAGRSANALASLEPFVTMEQADENALELAPGIYESTGDSQKAIDMLAHDGHLVVDLSVVDCALCRSTIRFFLGDDGGAVLRCPHRVSRNEGISLEEVQCKLDIV